MRFRAFEGLLPLGDPRQLRRLLLLGRGRGGGAGLRQRWRMRQRLRRRGLLSFFALVFVLGRWRLFFYLQQRERKQRRLLLQRQRRERRRCLLGARSLGRTFGEQRGLCLERRRRGRRRRRRFFVCWARRSERVRREVILFFPLKSVFAWPLFCFPPCFSECPPLAPSSTALYKVEQKVKKPRHCPFMDFTE